MSEWLLPFGSSPSGEPQADDRSIEPEEEGEARVRPDKTQSVTANLTATYSLIERLGLILELNSVTSAKEFDYNLIVILTKGF